jgi:predicted ATPase
MKRYILTGTPGAGKTSIIRLLESLGHLVVEEAATDIIAVARLRGDPAPERQPGFIDDIVTLQKQRQMQVSEAPAAVQFYDRSPACTHALSVFLGYPISAALADEIARIERERIYERQVFFIENMGFCEPTEARRISFADALEFERVHLETYRSLGYECIMVPPRNPWERAREITERVERLMRLEHIDVEQADG